MAPRRISRTSRPNSTFRGAGLLIVLLIAFVTTLLLRWSMGVDQRARKTTVAVRGGDDGGEVRLSEKDASFASDGEVPRSMGPPSLHGEPPSGTAKRAECGERDDTEGNVRKGHDDVADGKHCNVEADAEYAGDVVQWGSQNIQQTMEGCCISCRAARGCNVWVWCGAVKGCRGGDGVFGECWLKRQPNAAEKQAFNRGEGVPW